MKAIFSVSTLCLLIVFATSRQSFAQDSTKTVEPDSLLLLNESNGPSDTVLIKSYADRFNPQKALLFAAILPGAGQVYTKKYWKVPLVYGGFISLGLVVNFYNDGYRKYKGELFDVLNGGISASNLNETQLRTVVDRARRERDFFIILTGLWYLLQITDAHVDAHLKEFDVNPNLKVRIEPSFKNDMWCGTQGGISISLRF